MGNGEGFGYFGQADRGDDATGCKHHETAPGGEVEFGEFCFQRLPFSLNSLNGLIETLEEVGAVLFAKLRGAAGHDAKVAKLGVEFSICKCFAYDVFGKEASAWAYDVGVFFETPSGEWNICCDDDVVCCCVFGNPVVGCIGVIANDFLFEPVFGGDSDPGVGDEDDV